MGLLTNLQFAIYQYVVPTGQSRQIICDSKYHIGRIKSNPLNNKVP